MNTDMTKTHSRLNQYCRFMALLTLIPILIMLISSICPFLYYFLGMQNIGLEFGGFSFIQSGIDNVDPKSLSGWQATYRNVNRYFINTYFSLCVLST
ncbi:hypothetical protein A9G23_01300 [Gilliamella sp. App4-10]|nr:hypothetical protein A9G23_01300 [Gilliamella apicola]